MGFSADAGLFEYFQTSDNLGIPCNTQSNPPTSSAKSTQLA
jgi:hypothetical protein